jgi:hypothetical protein
LNRWRYPPLVAGLVALWAYGVWGSGWLVAVGIALAAVSCLVEAMAVKWYQIAALIDAYEGERESSDD